nr:UbiA family prenyltransferase [Tumebacillus amylolyticus]
MFFLGLFLSFLTGTVVNLGNTVTDIREDKVNLPHRVQIARLYGLRRLLVVNHDMSFLMILLAFLTFKVTFFLVMIVAVWLMNQYSFPPLRLKRHPFLSLLNFSCAISFPFSFGFLLQTDGTVWPPAQWTWLCVLCTLFFGLFGTAKNLQDYDGDKAAGIRTTATMFATKKAAVFFIAACITTTPLLFIFPILWGSFPVQMGIVPLWSLIICPIMALNYKFRHNPEMLKTLQSVFFLYPILFLGSLCLITYSSLTMAGVVFLHLCLLVLVERLGLDARKPSTYRTLQRLRDEQTTNLSQQVLFK